MEKWILSIWSFLIMTYASAFMSADSSPINDEGDKGSNLLFWPIPSPLPPFNANITDVLKMLPLPSQMPLHKNNPDKTNNGLSKAAEWLRNSLNQSVNPCEDFYEFTCGKWLSNNPIPADLSYINQFTRLIKGKKQQMHELMVDPKTSSSKTINQMKYMYNTCMKYDRKRPSNLLDRINEFGGWPILRGSEWDPECFNLAHVLAKIKLSVGSCHFLMGSCHIFMEPKVEQSQYNASQQTIYFYQTHLGLGLPKNYRNHTKLEEYARRIMGMVKVLASDVGIDLYDEKIRQEVGKIIEFEKEVANITKHKSWKEIKESFKIHRFSKLAKILPELNFIEYYKTLLPNNQSFHKYFASDPEIFFDDTYFGKLNSLLAKSSKTTLANYVMLRYVMEWSNKHLDDRLEPKEAENIDKLDMDCFSWVVQEFRHASEAMFVRKYFNIGTKNAVLKMVENIRDAFRTMLGQNIWMDPVTKKRAIMKLTKVIPQIGYPDFYLNDTKLDAYYSKLNIDDTDSYSSMLEKTSNFNTAKEFEKLLALTDRTEFDYEIGDSHFVKTKNIISK